MVNQLEKLRKKLVPDKAPATLKYFREQGVVCKVISGDSGETVSGIARRAGMENWDQCIDMSQVSKKDIPDAAEKYTVFPRLCLVCSQITTECRGIS